LNGISPIAQSHAGFRQILIADEQIIGVEGRESEHTDAGIGQRSQQVSENADEREIQRSRHAKTAPIAFTANVFGHSFLPADDRQFLRGAGL
jgi:hypothetical protein